MKFFKLALKEIRNSPWQLVLFSLCIVLSVSSFIALEGFNQNVNQVVLSDTKELAGGDIIVESNRAYSQSLTDKLLDLDKRYEMTNNFEFNSIVYAPYKNTSTLVEIKSVGNLYPLYGQVELQSGRNFSSLQKTGVVLVEPDVLTSLNVTIGEIIKVGDIELVIEDVILKEPDRSLNFFSLGSRVMIFENDLVETQLVTDRSRVDYETYIKVPEVEVNSVVEEIELFKQQRERVEIAADETSDISTFIDVFLSFITLILFFTILLAGIGMSTTLFTFIESKKKTIAIMKTFGEKNKQITKLFLFITLLIGVLSTIIGIILGIVMQYYLPEIFANIIPEDIIFSLSISALLKGILLALIIIVIFSLFPLGSLKKIKPLQILREQDLSVKNSIEQLFYLILLILFVIILISLEFNDLVTGIAFTLGFFGLFSIMYAIEYIIFHFLRNIRPKLSSFYLRISLAGLFRPGSKNLLFVTTIATTLSIIFTISLLQLNVEEQFVTSFPEDAPNVFFLDLKKDQLISFEETLGQDVIFYPVIRGPILEVNGQSIGDVQEALGPGEPVTREFSLTYYENENLLGDERFVQESSTGGLFVENWNKDTKQVSVLTEISDRLKLDIGDKIIFLVQGIEIEAEVVSIRERTTNNFSPFFYFVFEKEELIDAPQTVFTTAKFPEEEIPSIQTKVAREFPQVTTIDISATAKKISELLNELSSVVKFFTGFSLIAGFLILISSLLSTSKIRLQEIIYFKLVGTQKMKIVKIVLLEYLIIGLLASIVGILLSTLTTFVLIKFFLELDYVFLLWESLLFIGVTTILIIIVGLFSTIGIFRKKPVEYLRKSSIE